MPEHTSNPTRVETLGLWLAILLMPALKLAWAVRRRFSKARPPAPARP